MVNSNCASRNKPELLSRNHDGNFNNFCDLEPERHNNAPHRMCRNSSWATRDDPHLSSGGLYRGFELGESSRPRRNPMSISGISEVRRSDLELRNRYSVVDDRTNKDRRRGALSVYPTRIEDQAGGHDTILFKSIGMDKNSIEGCMVEKRSGETP